MASELALPEAFGVAAAPECDVRVTCAGMPAFLAAERRAGYRRWTRGFRQAWFTVPGAGECFAENGDTLRVAPEPGGALPLLRSLLLSAGLCLILLQRHVPVLHGTGLVVQGRAAVLCGASGVGKSTVACRLLTGAGVGFLADDTVALGAGAGGVLAQPTGPRQKLCADMAERFGIDPRALTYIGEGRDKYSLQRTGAYCPEATPLGAVFLMRRRGGADVRLRPITGAAALIALVDSLYLARTYRHTVGLPAPLMKRLAAVAAAAPVYEMLCPNTGDWSAEAAAAVMQAIAQPPAQS